MVSFAWLTAIFLASSPLFGGSQTNLPDGITYEVVRDGRRIVHLAQVDLSRRSLRVVASRPEDRGLTVPAFAAKRNTVIAINGDFFGARLRPLGMAVGEGLSWGISDTDGWSFIACTYFNLCTIDTSGEALPHKPQWKNVVGGRRILVRDGIPFSEGQDRQCGSFCTTHHPRTAIGLDRLGTKLILAVVEGRQKSVSGMPLSQLARFLASRGVWTGLNLDGGGSSTMTLYGRRVTGRPDNEQTNRPVANCLGITSTH